MSWTWILIPNTLKMILSRFSQECAKSTQLLTQIVSHPALWHWIKPVSLGHTLSPHRHRNKPLMSLHLCLQPMHVSSESRNKIPKPDDSGSGHLVSVMVLDFICACPMCVILELRGSRTEPDRSGLVSVTGTVSALAIGATTKKTWRLARKWIPASNITHHHILGLVHLCNYLPPSQPVWHLIHHPTLPPPCHGHCKCH